jgi:hypothetical protein
LSRPMQCLKRGRGRGVSCLPPMQGGGGGGERDYPVLEFKNNLWGLGTE